MRSPAGAPRTGRRRPRGATLALLVPALAACAAWTPAARGESLTLVPPPAQLEWLPGSAGLSSRWTVRVPPGSPADTFAASLLIEDVRTRFGWRWSVADRPGPAVILRAARPSHRASEIWNRQGYELEVWLDSIVVRAPTATGRYYGVQTLRQIVRGSADAQIPGLVIRDGPAFEARGLSEDVSRGQMPTLDEFRRTLAGLGFYKANLYELYIEDTFAFPGAPEVGRGRTRLTPADLAAIVEEGRRHHVAVVPIFETLGHQQRLLRLPQHRRLAEIQPVASAPWTWHTAGPKLSRLFQALFFGAPDDEDPAPWSFAPALPEARDFVKRRITELAEAAPGGWFHIGGDEAFDVGHGLSRSRTRAGRGEMLAGYFAEMGEHLRGLGRRTMVYADELVAEPAALARAPKDLTLVYWNYRGAGADTALFAIRAAGFAHVHVSPGLWDWLSFAPHCGRAFSSIATLVARGAESLAEGVVVASWGDGGAESFKVLNGPGVAYTADAAWAGAADTSGAFLRRFTAVHFGARSRGLAEALRRIGWQEFENVGWYGRLYHRVPRLKPRAAGWLARMRALERDMAEARRRLAADGRPRWNRDEIPYFDHAARRFAFAARRELLLHEIAGMDSAARAGRRGAAAERRLRSLAGESDAIALRFEELWRARYRLGTLRSNLSRLGRQTAGLEGLRAQAFPGAPPSVGTAPAPRAAGPPRLTRAEQRRLARERALRSSLDLSAGY